MNITPTPSYFNNSILQNNNGTFGQADLSCSSDFAGEFQINNSSSSSSSKFLIHTNNCSMSAATATASATDESGVGGGAKSNMTPLPLNFVPGDFDVLCGRGKKNYNSLGKLPFS